jgi:hypothetical protein
MIPSQITESVLALPEGDRLELARRIVESIAAEHSADQLIADGVKRIEQVVMGEVRALNEEEFRRALG